MSGQRNRGALVPPVPRRDCLGVNKGGLVGLSTLAAATISAARDGIHVVVVGVAGHLGDDAAAAPVGAAAISEAAIATASAGDLVLVAHRHAGTDHGDEDVDKEGELPEGSETGQKVVGTGGVGGAAIRARPIELTSGIVVGVGGAVGAAKVAAGAGSTRGTGKSRLDDDVHEVDGSDGDARVGSAGLLAGTAEEVEVHAGHDLTEHDCGKEQGEIERETRRTKSKSRACQNRRGEYFRKQHDAEPDVKQPRHESD